MERREVVMQIIKAYTSVKCEKCWGYTCNMVTSDSKEFKAICNDCMEKMQKEKRMSEQLKDCPLCGQSVKWVSGSIRCECGVEFRPNYGATDKWNNRENK